MLDGEECIATIAGNEVAVIPVAISTTNASSSAVTQLTEPVCKYTYYLEHEYNPHVDIKKLAAQFDGIVLANPIEELNGKGITINYEHIFALETKVRTSQTGVVTRKQSIHHDYKNYFENNGFLPLLNKSICLRTDCYKAGIFIDCMSKPKANTFFPPYWEPEQVRDAILDALNDLKREVRIDRNNQIIVFGNTQQAYEIKIVLSSEGRIETAYPSEQYTKGFLW